MIKTILFDVDGVLLSEDHYFDASALTVWELLVSDNYLGLMPEKFKTDFDPTEIAVIRMQVFENDRVLKFLKSRGLNANWDMIFLTFSYQLIHLLSQIREAEVHKINRWLTTDITRDTLREIGQLLKKHHVTFDFDLFHKDFQKLNGAKQELFIFLDHLVKEKFGFETTIFQKKGTLWSICEHISQEWYVGDENVFDSTGRPSVQLGKRGFLADEKTLCDREEINQLFMWLISNGFSIGIGTGRPELETIKPFEHLDWLRHFDLGHVVTADEVLKAQKEVKMDKSFSKPHPYTYVQAFLGKDYSSADCLNTQLPMEEAEEILIIGDSLADLLAAREMGARFAAVLTGLSGQDARGDFEKHRADYILDNVLELKGLLKTLEKSD